MSTIRSNILFAVVLGLVALVSTAPAAPNAVGHEKLATAESIGYGYGGYGSYGGYGGYGLYGGYGFPYYSSYPYTLSYAYGYPYGNGYGHGLHGFGGFW